jgi:hypothetical protein
LDTRQVAGLRDIHHGDAGSSSGHRAVELAEPGTEVHIGMRSRAEAFRVNQLQLRSSERTPALFSRINDAPDGTRSVVGDEDRSVVGLCNAYGTAPCRAVRICESGEEILVLAGCMPVLHR